MSLSRLSITLLFIVFSMSAFAQKEENPTAVALQIGAGIAGFTYVPGGVLDDDTTRSLESSINRKPVIMASIDHRLGKRFSVGAMIGMQNLNVSASDSITGALFESGTVHRYYAGFRGNWHYGKSDKIDMYSGFKFGTIIFQTGKVTNNHSGESEIERENNRTRPTFGFTPFGIRFLPTENFGMCIETSIGSPSFLSFGANYCF